jgi:hypothetical protein
VQRLLVCLVERFGKSRHEPPARRVAAELGEIDDTGERLARDHAAERGAAKGFVERLLDIGARVAIVDPLGVWWGLRASADGAAAGYPVGVLGSE